MGLNYLHRPLHAAKIFLALSLCGGIIAGVSADGAPVTETEKIEYLIASVEQLSDAKFVRNGTEYDAQAAADHLRLKWHNAGDRIKTAEDFIRLCASASSVSGHPYRIKFADGTVMESATFFRGRLQSLANRTN